MELLDLWILSLKFALNQLLRLNGQFLDLRGPEPDLRGEGGGGDPRSACHRATRATFSTDFETPSPGGPIEPFS